MAKDILKQGSSFYESPRLDLMVVTAKDVICSSPEKENGTEWGDGGSWDIFD